MDNPDDLLARATRLTTPCGDGDLVWHRWGIPGGAPVVLTQTQSFTVYNGAPAQVLYVVQPP